MHTGQNLIKLFQSAPVSKELLVPQQRAGLIGRWPGGVQEQRCQLSFFGSKRKETKLRPKE